MTGAARAPRLALAFRLQLWRPPIASRHAMSAVFAGVDGAANAADEHEALMATRRRVPAEAAPHVA